MPRHPLRDATPFALDAALVESCLTDKPVDAVFRAAFRESLSSVPRDARSGALAGTTGHIAESVIEVVLNELGYAPLWHFTGPGGHGIDLAMLSPAMDRVIVLEVKGTLSPRRLPRLTRGELAQLSDAWIDKRDNPGMANLEMTSEDVYGAMAIVQFAERNYRIGLSADFATLHPVVSLDQLTELDWLDG
jgi:hypothetical protein